ncbi:MAG: hypothetical protein R3C56_23880 [Pirellulaceae bacterium]
MRLSEIGSDGSGGCLPTQTDAGGSFLARARETFFDKRVHHTSGSAGMLIYVSLFERIAVVIGDQAILDKLGQTFLDQLCRQLTEGLRQNESSDAICNVIAEAGRQLSGPFPRIAGDVNELHDALVLID